MLKPFSERLIMDEKFLENHLVLRQRASFIRKHMLDFSQILVKIGRLHDATNLLTSQSAIVHYHVRLYEPYDFYHHFQ